MLHQVLDSGPSVLLTNLRMSPPETGVWGESGADSDGGGQRMDQLAGSPDPGNAQEGKKGPEFPNQCLTRVREKLKSLPGSN
jgi:hypothetical protein